MKTLTEKYIAKILPKRPSNANKGTFGKVLVIAGSKNFPGAAYLSSAATYRVGAGLVSLITSDSVKTIVSRKLPEVTFLSQDELDDKKLSEYDVILLGPGIGQENKTKKFVEELLKKDFKKIIIDADGLNILSLIDRWWDKLKGEVVLTPHPGEMSRLTGLTVDEIQKGREVVVKRFAKKWGQVVILKGANSLVVSPNGEIAMNPFANPALATAGTGDVLSGIVAGFIAQGLSTFDAACVGCFIHGLAGEMLRKELGDGGMLASDLLPQLPKILVNISKQRIS